MQHEKIRYFVSKFDAVQVKEKKNEQLGRVIRQWDKYVC